MSFRTKNKEIDGLIEINDELKMMSEIDREVERKTKDMEISQLTKALHSERCNFETLRKEHNCLKVIHSIFAIIETMLACKISTRLDLAFYCCEAQRVMVKKSLSNPP